MQTSKKYRISATFAVLAAIVFLSGCAVSNREMTASDVGGSPMTFPNWMEKLRQAQLAPSADRNSNSPLSQLMDDIDRRPLAIQTVAARMNVQIIPANGRTVSLSGQYLGDSAGNFRLKLTGMFGILGLDLCSKSGQITGYMPTKKIAFQCSREQIEVSSSLELILLSRIGQARELFFPRAWDSGAIRRRVKNGERDMLEVDVLSSKSEIPLRRISVDPDQKAVIAEDVFKCDGKPIGRSQYSKFVSYASIASDRCNDDTQAAAVPIPTLINVATRQVSFEFTLESLSVNREIDGKSFELQLPENTPLTPLSELSREGNCLFSK